MRRFALVTILAALLSSPAGFGQPSISRPRLVLVLSIDQGRFDYFERFDPLYKAGLRMLLDRGAVFTDANYRHACTETGPGHSVILSGRHPSHSGIVANEWYDAYLKKVINVVDDPVQGTLGGPGRAASPANFLGFTVGDALRAQAPESHVIGVSMKDRSAILMAGRRADAAYWFENEGGNFVTSTYYMSAAPSWLTVWNSRRSAERFSGQPWNRLLPDVSVYEKYAGKDEVAGENDRKNITFPHSLASKAPATQYYVDLRRTPFIDEITAEFAIEAMKQHRLGLDDATDIFAVSFAGTDGVGHSYGPDSQEILDQFLRLDLVLGRFFKELDTAVGLDNVLIILTADHGSRTLVEVQQSRGIAARRVAPAVLRQAVDAAFARKYPGIQGLVSYFAIDFYLDEEVIGRNNLSRSEVEQTAIAALQGTGLVERVYTHDDLRNKAASSDPYLQLFRNAFFESRTPHLSVMLKRDVYPSADAGGTGHGSAYDFDRHVPVVFMGKGIAAGKYASASGPEDVAPTLAHLLGLRFPIEYDARLLTEMLSPGNSVNSATGDRPDRASPTSGQGAASAPRP